MKLNNLLKIVAVFLNSIAYMVKKRVNKLRVVPYDIIEVDPFRFKLVTN